MLTITRRISRLGAAVMVSMVVHCMISFNIVTIMMNPSNYKHLYHFGLWFIFVGVSFWKIIVNTPHSGAIMYLVYLGCIITICSMVMGLFDVHANDGNVQAKANRIGWIKKYLLSFIFSYSIVVGNIILANIEIITSGGKNKPASIWRRISRFSAVGVVSMVILCLIGIGITSDCMDCCSHLYLYDFGS